MTTEINPIFELNLTSYPLEEQARLCTKLNEIIEAVNELKRRLDEDDKAKHEAFIANINNGISLDNNK